jgi:hypothetical protein
MYRILDDQQEVRERRNQLRHPDYPTPQLVACLSADRPRAPIRSGHGTSPSCWGRRRARRVRRARRFLRSWPLGPRAGMQYAPTSPE